MRTSLGKDDFLVVAAKKKPRLQALLDDLPNLTEEAIQALSEPLWVKQGLMLLKKGNGSSQKQRMEALIERTIEAEKAAALMPPQTYEVRIWDCEPMFIGCGNCYGDHKFQIQIERGDCLMILEHGCVIRVGNTMINIDPFEVTSIMYNSTFVGYMTEDNYRGFIRELLNQKHKIHG